MATFLVEDFPAELVEEVTRSAAARRVPVGAELARLVSAGLTGTTRPPVPPPLPYEPTIEMDVLLQMPGPPYIIADFEFPDPPGVPIVPISRGQLPAELCCDIDDPSQRAPE